MNRSRKIILEEDQKHKNKYNIIRELVNRDKVLDDILEASIELYDNCHDEEKSKDIIDNIHKCYERLCEKYNVKYFRHIFTDEVSGLKERYEEALSGKETLNPLNFFLVSMIKEIILEINPDTNFSGRAGEALTEEILEKIIPSLFYARLTHSHDKELFEIIKPIVTRILHEVETGTYIELSDKDKRELIRKALRNFIKYDIFEFGWFQPLQAHCNWSPPSDRSPDGCPRNPGQSATLAVTVDLSKVKLIGISKAGELFKALLQEAVDNVPEEWITYPKDLEFLRTISIDRFKRDLRRYDLHMKDGLTFRQIAMLERLEEKGQPIPSSLQKMTIGEEITGEDGVEKSVKKIYQAIYRKPYRARRRRLDAPAGDMETYACSEHLSGDCTLDCPYLQDFMARYNALAPTDNSGMGRQMASLSTLDAKDTSMAFGDEEYY